MGRKKLSEMTPYERVDSRMKGMSWEEAEEVGVHILGKCLALHIFAREEDEEYMEALFRKVVDKANEWRKSDYGAHVLAWAHQAWKREQKEKEVKK